MRQRAGLPALIVLLLLPVPGIGGDDAQKSLQKQLREEIIGRNLVIRNFYAGSLLKYDSGGALAEGGKPGIWTVHGIFRPTGVKLSGQGMEIRGKRLCWTYDVSTKTPVYLALPASTKILVELTPEQYGLSSIREIVHRIFLTGSEPIEDFVPSYWRAFLEAKRGIGTPGGPEAVGLIPKPPAGWQEPRQVHNELPHYTAEARMARLSGSILVKIVIDEGGNASVEEILQPLGAGLEENAVEAIGRWVFLPALLNDRPVKMPAIVEVMFRLD